MFADNNSKRLDVQFSEAREAFQDIANKQADAMHVSIHVHYYINLMFNVT